MQYSKREEVGRATERTSRGDTVTVSILSPSFFSLSHETTDSVATESVKMQTVAIDKNFNLIIIHTVLIFHLTKVMQKFNHSKIQGFPAGMTVEAMHKTIPRAV
jgi:hypothetical protein